jgi:two-component system, sensor histidine kinase LadS
MTNLFSEKLSASQLDAMYQNDELVLEFIAKVKWSEGFTCRKCGHTNYCEGKRHYSRRCTRCKAEESATAHTLFHNCKFPISKAFFIAYKICKEGADLSTYAYARQLDVRQMTCWKFRHKIETCMASKKAQAVEPTLRQILLMELPAHDTNKHSC